MSSGMIFLAIVLVVGYVMAAGSMAQNMVGTPPTIVGDVGAETLANVGSQTAKELTAAFQKNIVDDGVAKKEFDKKSNVTRDDIKVGDEYTGCGKTLKFTYDTRFDYNGEAGYYFMDIITTDGEIPGSIGDKNGGPRTDIGISIGNNDELLFNDTLRFKANGKCVMKKVSGTKTSGYTPRLVMFN